MLKQRVITALVLLAVLVPAVFYPNANVFAAVALILIAAGAWEWGRLNHFGQTASLAAALFCTALCVSGWTAGLLQRPLYEVWLVGTGAWVLLGVWLLGGGVQVWSAVPRSLRLIAGILGLCLAWIAVTQARMRGINFLFSILVLVWVADICAYFFGRALGNRFFDRKLAPTISPGKTWEGALGGMLSVVLLAFLWHSIDGHWLNTEPSLYSNLANIHWTLMVLGVVFLATMSVVGDLVESLFKRSAGVKDSSGLLPGHGGVLDRVDALLPVLPIAMFLSNL